MIPIMVAALSAAICAAQSEGLALEKNEGEVGVRRPRGSLAIPTPEFILKVFHLS
jgi:hypothetical protein